MIAIDGPFSADEALSLFPLGFLVTRQGAPLPEALRPWPVQGLGGFCLHTHPDCPMWRQSGAGGAVVVAGPCYGVHGGDRAAAMAAFAETGDEAQLDRLAGRFVALFTGPDGEVRLRHDPFGSRTVAIDLLGGAVCAASHPGLLAHVLGRGPDPATVRLVANKEFRRKVPLYLPGNGSVHEGIAHLLPNHDFLPDSGRMQRFWPRAPWQPGSRDRFLSLAKEHFDGMSQAARAEGWQMILGATAGQDSRAVLAGLKPSGRIDVCVTWTGNYLKPAEIPAIERLAEHTGLPHDLIEPLPLAEAGLPDLALRAMAVAGAGVRPPSGLTAGMMQLSGPGRVFLRGYGGEIMRGFYNRGRDLRARQGKRVPDLPAAPDLLFPALYLSLWPDAPENRGADAFRTAVSDAFARMIALSDYRPAALRGFDPMDIFYWEHRMGIWGAMMLNEMDAALPSLVGLNSRPMYEAAMRLPAEYRYGRAMMDDVIALFDPALVF